MTTSFDDWELAARTALAQRGIEYHQAPPLTEDARMPEAGRACRSTRCRRKPRQER
jgi:hypothetical protein